MQVSGSASVADIVAVADGASVVVPREILLRLDHAHHEAEDLAGTTPVYGRTTGVGANKTTVVGPDPEHGLRLLRSHAVDAGPALPQREVRAMLAVRLNQLCHPGSGVASYVIDGLVAMLNQDALPSVRRFSSIGTGDLGALAGTALTLLGERTATRPWTPITSLGPDSALPFISSNAMTLGQACLAVDELRTLLAAAETVYALHFIALEGNPSAWSAVAAHATGSPEAVRLSARLARMLLPLGAQPRRIQDPFGLRVFLTTHSEALEALTRLEVRVTALIRLAQENPLYLNGEVVHHGGFYQAGLGLAIEGLLGALAQTPANTFARIRMAHDPDQTGLPPFLAGPAPGASGTMMVEYVAASAIAEIRHAADPASSGTLSLSRGAEEDAPFASQSIAQLKRATEAEATVLACELLVAVRLVRLRGLSSHLAPPLQAAYRTASVLPSDTADRDLRDDLEVAQHLLPQLRS